MFETIVAAAGSGRRRARKGLTLSLSLLLHGAAIAVVIVMPLLRAESSLPGYKIIDATLVAPPILPGVPPGPGRSGKAPAGPTDPRRREKETPAATRPRGFMAPVEIPNGIADEDPTKNLPGETDGPGVDGGVGDGKAPWVLGEDILPEEIKLNAHAITTIRAPRLIKKVNPGYPPLAIASHVSGAVVIEASTDVYGRVKEARIINGHALLNASALEAVRMWIYEPYLVNGIPHPVRFVVTVTFALEKH